MLHVLNSLGKWKTSQWGIHHQTMTSWPTKHHLVPHHLSRKLENPKFWHSLKKDIDDFRSLTGTSCTLHLLWSDHLWKFMQSLWHWWICYQSKGLKRIIWRQFLQIEAKSVINRWIPPCLLLVNHVYIFFASSCLQVLICLFLPNYVFVFVENHTRGQFSFSFKNLFNLHEELDF